MRKSLRTRNEPQNYSVTSRSRPEVDPHPHPHTRPPIATSSNSAFAVTTNVHEPISNNIGPGREAEGGYGDMHKIVLQGIMSAGYLDAKGVKKLFIGACTYLKLSPKERTNMKYVQQIVKEINDRIRTYDMAIKSASCELTGKKYYIFLITVEKPIMKLQTLFSAFEIELFQKCMERILRAYNNFSVPLQECIELSRDIQEPRASMELGKSFIEKMIDFNYFTKYELSDDEYNITLGIRTIREFEPILRQLYHDVVAKCSSCNLIMLHGYLCPACKLLIHKPCWLRYVQISTNCPNCKLSWAREKDMIRRVREVEPEMEYDFSGENPSSQEIELPQTPITNMSSVETHMEDGDDDDIDMPILEPEPMIQPSRKRKGRRKRAHFSSSEDSE